MTGKPTQHDIAERALAQKQKAAAHAETGKPEDRTAHEGMHPVENEREAPSGALDHAGQHPAMQRAKFARQEHRQGHRSNAVAQEG